jgi:GDP-4-dehydro-6-deoxy-D-mannose reductase
MIEAGKKEPIISVGNLEAKRDFTDVRDIVRAYVMLAEKGRGGQTYNVGSGKAVRIADILDMIIAKAKCPIEVKTDPARMRPSDVPIHCADTEKLRAETGWEQKYTLDQTIEDTLNYFRDMYAKDQT